MSGFDVHPDEMPAFPPLDDAALEAFLTGRNGAADEIEPLALFADDLGTAMGGPGPSPTPHLALLLAEGFSSDPRPATTQAGPPEPRRRKMLVSELLTGLAAKLAGLGLAAKLGLGVGVAAASVGSAGAAGVLPGPVQDVLSTVVSAVTPFELPGDDTTKDAGGDADDEAGEDTNANNDFGKAVSADATGESDGVKGVDGQAVSEVARNKNNDKAGGNGGGGGGTPNANAGATGLDRANSTPAAGNVPTSVPGPANGTTGIDRANQTPAAGNVPTSVPPPGGSGGSGGSTGLDKANDTPANGRVPTSTGRP